MDQYDASSDHTVMQKAFALACRIMSDNFPILLPDNQSWQDYILERVQTEPVCRICGCTEDNACSGGCYWAEPDLCSTCAKILYRKETK
ncbi:MAG: hypothetical protein AAGU75_09745 [Bacillota bacterium]